ncbi:MAG: tRNA (adenosine(37)-N6)-threonylcarbamoyltransferase complex ATPase subunit type 1 TsaE [Candidatus Paceibacterota bacterium]|jgi:tRNA threonylcarbamoyladenosine biosynthesis protein TsaE
MKKIVSHSLEETQVIARDYLIELANKYNKSDKAVVVGLSGHLGAGKTAFVKAVAKELGVVGEITSPTFVIMKMYSVSQKIVEKSRFHQLIHIDAYRLENAQELEILNLQRLMLNKYNLIMIEWPENVGLKTDEQINMQAIDKGGLIELEIQ